LHGQIVELPHAFMTVPHAPLQVGTGHVHELPEHTSPLVHVLGQFFEPPHAFVTVPHATPEQLGVGQLHVVPEHVSPLGHVLEQVTLLPQPLGAELQWPWQGFAVGTQHLVPPSWQRPPLTQAPLFPQFVGLPQLSVVEPQSRFAQGAASGAQAPPSQAPQL
jgi:hypothetical protein